jgi:hypothetical protein
MSNNDNLTFLGGVADDFDSKLHDSEHILDKYVESSKYSKASMLVASTTIAFMRFGQSFTDVLRIGNGLAHGTWKGAVQDGLRLLTATGVAGAAFSRVTRILAVTQRAGTFTCTWISVANALQRTGQRFFVSIEELAESADVDLEAIAKAGGSTAEQCKRLVGALKKMNVFVEELQLSGKDPEVLHDLLKSRPNGVVVFAVEAGETGKRFDHQLLASLNSNSVVIFDTDGAVYPSLKAFGSLYKDAKLVPGFTFFIKNSALLSGSEISRTAGGLSGIVLELLPLKMRN